MLFNDFISSNAIVDDLASTDKSDAIVEMVDALIAAGSISSELRQGVLTALFDREKVGSTGLQNGIAIPHAKHPGIKKLTGLFARSREGVAFDALDGEPTHLFFLLLSNQECIGDHLGALAYISKHLRGDIFSRFLKNARDAKEIYELLVEADEKALSGG